MTRQTDPTDWEALWATGDIFWHQAAPDEAMKKHFADWAPARIFLPLCGKSLDLAWLAAQGHEVVGAELSQLAVRAYFDDHHLVPSVRAQGPFQVYEAGGVTIWQGDFFALTPEWLGPIDAVYDRAALVALPLELRQKYTTQIETLINGPTSGRPDQGDRGDRDPGRPRTPRPFQILQLTFERNPRDGKGPPFSVSEAELSALYGRGFEIEKRDVRKLREEPGANVRVVYRLKKTPALP